MATMGEPEVLQAAIRSGRDPKNWSKQWTHERYGVAEQVARVLRHSDTITLERANEELTLEGFEPLGPDYSPFVWGPITTIHRVGGHAIVESTPDPRESGGGQFTVYTTVDGEMRSTSHGFDSLDAALLHAIVYAAESRRYGINGGANERLTGYLRRILEL